MKTKDFHIYVFDLIEQNVRESFDSFVYRLQLAAEKCQFVDEEGEVRRKVIAKCRFDNLRRVALNKYLDFEELLRIGRNSELAEKAEKSLDSNGYQRSQSLSSTHSQFLPKDDFCTRCGSNNHLFYYKGCPAIKHLCTVCHNTGHLDKFCFHIVQPRGAIQRGAISNDKINPLKRRRIQITEPPKSSKCAELGATEIIKSEPKETYEVSKIKASDPTLVKIAHHEVLFEFVDDNKVSSMQVSSALRNEELTKRSSNDRDGIIKKKPEKKQEKTQNIGKTYQCKIGGVKQIVMIRDANDNCHHNVITKALYRVLRSQNFKFHSPILESIEVSGNQYCGSFETDLENEKRAAKGVRFYVIDEIIQQKTTIDEKYAKILNLC